MLIVEQDGVWKLHLIHQAHSMLDILFLFFYHCRHIVEWVRQVEKYLRLEWRSSSNVITPCLKRFVEIIFFMSLQSIFSHIVVLNSTLYSFWWLHCMFCCLNVFRNFLKCYDKVPLLIFALKLSIKRFFDLQHSNWGGKHWELQRDGLSTLRHAITLWNARPGASHRTLAEGIFVF